MKVLIVAFLALVAGISARTITLEDVLTVEETTGYMYHERFGIPRAEEIRAAEEKERASRIVGGSHASAGQFPYKVGLVMTLNNGQQSVCGGGLIKNNRVTTAAHCCAGVRSTVAVLGSLTLFSGGTRITSTNCAIHPNYNSNTLNNDVAVLRINAVNFSNLIGTIGMFQGSNNHAGATCTAIGFGRTGDGAAGGITNNQRKSFVQLQGITNAQCAQTYGNIIVGSTFCCQGSGGRSTCGGDSGGPLVNGGAMVGITSFGPAAGCQRGLPVGFARVSSFFSWLNSQ